MPPFKTPADNRVTELFIKAVPDGPPGVAAHFCAPGTNRLADSEDLDDSEDLVVEVEVPCISEGALEPATGFPEFRLAQYDPGPDHRHTAVALLAMMGYLTTVGILLCS